MKNSLHIARNQDVLPLLLELQRKPHLWNRNTARLNPAGPHRETDDIWIRYKDETGNKATGDYSNFSDEHDPIWYPAYYELAESRKLIFELMARVRGERLGGVLLYRIPPGKQIYPHTDMGWHVSYYEKFNICLQSNPDAVFYYDDEDMRCVAGDVHWFRNDIPHYVVNNGNDDHIILTVCIRVNREGICRTDG